MERLICIGLWTINHEDFIMYWVKRKIDICHALWSCDRPQAPISYPSNYSTISNHNIQCQKISDQIRIVGSMPRQLLEIGSHVEIHAIEWHDFQRDTQFHGVVVAWIEFSLYKESETYQDHQGEEDRGGECLGGHTEHCRPRKVWQCERKRLMN